MANGTPTTTEQVLIEFITDFSEVETAVDKLEKTGAIDSQLATKFKATTAEVNKQAASIQKLGQATAPVKKTLQDTDKATKDFVTSFAKGFEEGVIAELKKAGITMQDFLKIIQDGGNKVGGSTETLKSKLRGLTVELANLKAAGQDNTAQYQKLVLEAGRLKDAIGDAQAEIRNAASDTRVFDGMISAVQGVAGAFAIAQGAAALFGEDNEELQKTLLKVNAAMVILQGLQQVQNVLQKESAASRLLDVAGTKAQIAVNKLYTFIMNGATIATKAFRAALVSTGIGAIIVLIGLLINELIEFLNRTDETTKGLEKMNEQLRLTGEYASDSVDAFKKANELIIAELEARGATEAEINAARLRGYDQQIEAAKKFYDEASNNFQQYDQMRAKSEEEYGKAYLSAQEIVNDAAKKYYDLVDSRERARLEIVKKNNDERKEIEKKQAEDAKEARLQQLQEELAAIKRRLIGVQEGSVEELRIRQQIIAQTAKIELNNDRLGRQQRALIREEAREEQLKLEREFNERLRKESIEAQIDRNTAELSTILDNNEEKLLLTISNIELAAQLEVDAANGNAAKIKDINAKRDAEIRDARKQLIEETTEREIDMIDLINAAEKRALSRLASDESKGVQFRIAAIQQLSQFEIDNIDKRLLALDEERDKKLIGDQEYNLRYKQLLDQRTRSTEEAEQHITDILESEQEKRKENAIRTIGLVVQVFSQVVEIIDQIGRLQSDREQQRVEGEKKRVEELLEAGAITEREAKARNKRLEAEERQLRVLQAQREKQAAVFKAALSIPQAFLQGLTQGGPVLAAIYAGLAAAEAIVIAARPIPRFRFGKKNRYKGPAEIGEAGAEILQRADGQSMLAKKSTIVWVGERDVVYNPQETREILKQHNVDSKLLEYKEDRNSKTEINAEVIAEIIAKEIKKIPGFNLSLDINGFNLSVKKGLDQIRYADKRYSSK